MKNFEHFTPEELRILLLDGVTKYTTREGGNWTGVTNYDLNVGNILTKNIITSGAGYKVWWNVPVSETGWDPVHSFVTNSGKRYDADNGYTGDER